MYRSRRKDKLEGIPSIIRKAQLNRGLTDEKDISSQRPKSMDWAQRKKWESHAHFSAICTSQISSHALKPCQKRYLLLHEGVRSSGHGLSTRGCWYFWKCIRLCLLPGTKTALILSMVVQRQHHLTFPVNGWPPDAIISLWPMFKVSTFLVSLPCTCVAYSHQVWGTLV